MIIDHNHINNDSDKCKKHGRGSVFLLWSEVEEESEFVWERERERTVKENIEGEWGCLFVLCCTIDYFDCVVVVERKMNEEEMKLIHA